MLDFLKSPYVKNLTRAGRISFEELENELSYTHISEEYDIKEFESVVHEVLKEFNNQNHGSEAVSCRTSVSSRPIVFAPT